MNAGTIVNNTAHKVVIIVGRLEYNSKIRKYSCSNLDEANFIEIPAGEMLNAKASQIDLPSIEINGLSIPMRSHQVWESVDPIPDDGNYHIVSALYLAAATAVGADTSRLLTVGAAVVNNDRIIGCAGLQASESCGIFKEEK